MPVVQIRLLGEDLIWCSHCGEVDNKSCATEEQSKICPLTEKKDMNQVRRILQICSGCFPQEETWGLGHIDTLTAFIQ